MNIYTTPAFPTLIHEVPLPCFNLIADQLVKDILEYKDNNPGVQKSNMGGYQSNDIFWRDEKFEEYFDYFDLYIKSAITSILDTNVEIQNAWFNVNQKDQYNFPHIHPGTVYACVLWVKIPKNPGLIWFQNHTSKSASDMVSVFLKNNFQDEFNSGTQMSFEPEAGNIIMFPGYLEHHVECTDDEEDRISIAFNYA
jgi:uncharacterized protein (TIGR02466 family)|tara:strand:+ start:732 stop:1319 length:588 start_codon:yes stop_codon:yes gene_type:complete